MKTSVNMIRKMDNYDVVQRTKDGYFDASNLLQQWNGAKRNPKRELKRFLNSPKTKLFIHEIENSPIAEVRNGDNRAFIEIKGRNTRRGRTLDKVWMHPYLFIDFAMWLSPKFKLVVIKFVYDQLMEYRNDAGDLYIGLSKAASKFHNVDYPRLAKGLNYIVFGRHEKGIRQYATEDQMKKMRDLEKNLAFSIDMGMIESFDELINKMRTIYLKKIEF